MAIDRVTVADVTVIRIPATCECFEIAASECEAVEDVELCVQS